MAEPKKKVPTLKPKGPLKTKGERAGMGDVMAVDKEMRYGKKVPAFEKQAVMKAKKQATKEEIKKGYEDSAHYNAANYKTGGMVGSATGQGYGAARRGGNLV